VSDIEKVSPLRSRLHKVEFATSPFGYGDRKVLSIPCMKVKLQHCAIAEAQVKQSA
jgi:hypothetical protein